MCRIPNIFEYATHELAQDAFICWLLSWADVKHFNINPSLHRTGSDLLKLFYEKANIVSPSKFTNMSITKQEENIDIFCTVNGDTAILIEDKIGTQQHSDQLRRYKDYVCNKGFDNIIPIYIQTGDQSDYRDVEKNGYTVIERRHLLTVLESENGKESCQKSDILRDFKDYLRKIENDVQSFATSSITQWKYNPWIGFYISLQNTIRDGNWNYVPIGNFLGFWWHVRKSDKCDVYLQLEQDKLCFKIEVFDEKDRSELRDQWHERIIEKCLAQGIKAKRPSRMGNGRCMTVAVLDQEYRIVGTNGLLDMTKTVNLIHITESILDSCL